MLLRVWADILMCDIGRVHPMDNTTMAPWFQLLTLKPPGARYCQHGVPTFTSLPDFLHMSPLPFLKNVPPSIGRRCRPNNTAELLLGIPRLLMNDPRTNEGPHQKRRKISKKKKPHPYLLQFSFFVGFDLGGRERLYMLPSSQSTNCRTLQECRMQVFVNLRVCRKALMGSPMFIIVWAILPYSQSITLPL